MLSRARSFFSSISLLNGTKEKSGALAVDETHDEGLQGVINTRIPNLTNKKTYHGPCGCWSGTNLRMKVYLLVQDVLIGTSVECLPGSNEAAEAEAQLVME